MPPQITGKYKDVNLSLFFSRKAKTKVISITQDRDTYYKVDGFNSFDQDTGEWLTEGYSDNLQEAREIAAKRHSKYSEIEIWFWDKNEWIFVERA